MSLHQHIPATQTPNAVATRRPSTPTLLGIAPELRNQIFELIAATTGKRVILGRKFVQIINGKHDGTINGQVPSAIVQHPLSRTCRQIRAEFDIFSHSKCQTYEFVVNNFDIQQMHLFSKLVSESKRKARWLARSPMKLRFQLDQNIVSSAIVLEQCMTLLKNHERRFLIGHKELPVVNDFLIISTYRDL
jgi:hypothetical protein